MKNERKNTRGINYEHLLFPVSRTLFEHFEYSSRSLPKLNDREREKSGEEETFLLERTNRRVTDDHHHVRVRRTEFDETGETGISHFHRLKRSGQFTAGKFELFDDVADLFEASRIAMLATRTMRNDQERRAFEEKNFIGVDNFGEILQCLL